jgi:hypothetical protein
LGSRILEKACESLKSKEKKDTKKKTNECILKSDNWTMARGVARRSVGTIDLRHLAPFKCGTLQIAALDPTFQLSESCSGTRAVKKATAN